MTSRNSDISLVIRAKNEADGAIKAVSGALEQLLGTQDRVSRSADNTGGSLAEMATTLSLLDKAFATISGASDRAAASFARQQAAIAESKTAYQALKAQAESAAAVLVKLNAQAASVGPPPQGMKALQTQIRLVETEYNRLTAQAEKLAATIARQESGTAGARSALQQLGSATIAAGEGVAAATAEIELQTQAFAENAAAAAQAKAAQAFFNRATPGLNSPNMAGSAAASAAVFEEADAAVRKLRADLNPLEAAQSAANAELQRYRDLLKAGQINSVEFAAAQRKVATDFNNVATSMAHANSAGGTGGLFGLKPFQLQNLGYQVNDVVSGLAMGQHASQILAQQGGQLVQIFPKVGRAIFSAFTNPAFLGAAAVVTGIAVALKDAADNADRLRAYTAHLGGRADGGAYDASALAAQEEALQNLGNSSENARAAIKTFVDNGIAPDKLNEFTLAANAMAETLGTKLPDAAKQLSEAFTGGYDDIVKLDQATGFLTTSELAHIRTLFDEGNAAQARTEALKIYADKSQDVAEKQRGSWAGAATELKGAWGDLFDTLGDTRPIQGTFTALSNLAGAARAALRDIRAMGSAGGTLQEILDKRNDITDLRKQLEGNPASATLLKAQIGDAERGLATLEARFKKLGGTVAQLSAGSMTPGAGRGDTINTNPNSPEAKARADRLADIADEKRLLTEKTLGDAARIRQAGELAYQAEIRKSGDTVIAGAEKALAIDKEKAAVQKDAAAKAKAAAASQKQREAGFADDIANNGRDQLVATAKQYSGFSENNPRRNGDLQTFFRQNGINVDPKMTAWCAAFVNAVLKTNGLPQSTDAAGNPALNARSFLSYGQNVAKPEPGDIVILKRGSGAQGNVGFFQGFTEKGDVSVLGGNTGDKVGTSTFSKNDVLGFRRAPSAGDVATQEDKAADALLKKQTDFNTALDDEAAKRKPAIASLTVENGLTGEALLAEQRRQAVAEAILAAQTKAKADGLTVSPEQIAEIEKTTGAYFDLAHAKDAAAAKRTTAEQPVTDLTAERDALQEQVKYYTDQGDQGDQGFADTLKPALDDVNDKLRAAIANLKEYYENLKGDPDALTTLGLTADQVDTIILKLDRASSETEHLGTVMGVQLGDVAQKFASGAADAFDQFAQSVAQGKNVFNSARDAFLSFAGDFLRQIAQMIEQQIIFNLISGFLRSFAGGIGGGGANSAGIVSGTGEIYHDGGVVGSSGKSRPMPWVNNMVRYHTGGIAGLAPNEIPAILQQGEEILTRGDARHVLNGGKQGSVGAAPPVVNVINAIDGADVVEQGLRTRAGEQAVLNLIQANSRAVKGMLG